MKKYLIILILATIAIFNASYLSYEAYQFWFTGAQSGLLGTMPCDISDTLSCSGILSNPRSLIFGVPFPMIALIIYPVIFLLALSGYIRKSLLEAKVLTGLTFGGMCFNSYVIYQETIVGIFCPLCALCSVIIVSIFILSIMTWKTEQL